MRGTDEEGTPVAVLPFAYFIWVMDRLGDFDIPRLVLLVQLAAIVVTMAVRRPPVRVTANLLFWVLDFVATYWPYSVGGFDWYQAGAPLVPAWLSNGVSLSSLAISLWARLSPGRNIGIVPAERTLVTIGAYVYVRHPIYSGILLGVLATGVSEFSWRTWRWTPRGAGCGSSRSSSRSDSCVRIPHTCGWRESGGVGVRASRDRGTARGGSTRGVMARRRRAGARGGPTTRGCLHRSRLCL